MHPCVSWKPKEIEQLRTDFLKGVPIKLIARALKRTPGSVNKALSRFEIRPARCFKERKYAIPSLHRKAKKPYVDEIAGRSGQYPLHPAYPSPWTSFATILEWLQAENISFKTLSHDTYMIDNRPLSKMQVVMYANKQRIERGYDVFLVENITW